MQAVAVTFVRFFLEPAGHIGEALNRLLTEAYRDLPFYLWLQVFALIVLLLVVSMFFMSGYRVRGWLWNIEPHRPVEPLRQRIQELEQERQSLREERRDLQRQLKDEQREHREQTVRLGELQVYILHARFSVRVLLPSSVLPAHLPGALHITLGLTEVTHLPEENLCFSEISYADQIPIFSFLLS